MRKVEFDDRARKELRKLDPEFPELDVWVIEVGDFSGVEDLLDF